MVSSRIVFLLGTLIAFAGNADAAATTCTGASGTFNTENNPDGTGVIACRCVDGYVSTGETNTLILGDVTLSCTLCAPGYYFSAGSATASAVCTQSPANKYHAGLKDLTSGYTAQTPTDCPTNSEAVAGSAALADCKVKAGYYIATESDSATVATSLVISIAPADYYAPGGASASEQVDATVAATRTACPFGGNTNSATGKTALTDCIPDGTGGTAGTTCGATAVKAKVVGGTCVCESTQYGSPKDANGLTVGVATQGCLAIAQKTMGSATWVTEANPGVATLTAHGFYRGQKLIYNVVSGGALLVTTGYTIADGTPIWVIPGSDANTFKLASSYDNAIAGTALAVSADGHANKFTPVSSGDCLANSATAYTASTTGEPLYSDCKVAAGYYISTETSTTDVLGSGALTISPTSHYAPGGASLSEQTDEFVAATRIACPYGGVTAATGKSLLTECTPSSTGTGGVSGTTCGAAAVNAKAVGGSCVCKANYFGTPLDTNDAKVLVATKGCTACLFGGTSADGATVQADCTPAATATTVNVGGTSVCAANYYGTPLDTNDATLLIATKGCTACPTNTESVAGSSALSACTVKAGYYIATKATSATDATGLVISAIPANFYGTGGTQASHQTTNTITATKVACPFGGTSLAGAAFVEDCVPDCGATTVNALSARGTCICAANYYGSPLDASDATTAVATKGCTACPTNSESAAGGAANLAACTVKAGYYIATESDSATVATSLVISIAPADYYAPGGASASEQVDATVAATRTACPYGGNTNSATGKTALTDCIPDGTGGTAGTTCGATAVKAKVVGGTCVCESTQWGKPVDANGLTVGVATQGCLAIAQKTMGSATWVTEANPGVATLTAHGFYRGQKLTYNVVGGGALLVTTGYTIADGTPIWVIPGSDANTFKLASSYDNAIAGTALAVSADGHANKFTPDSSGACPSTTQTAYTSTVAGAQTLADCEVAAGFYISTKTAAADNVVGSMAALQITANHYAPGGYDANLQASDVSGPVTTTSFACPFAGTTVRAGGKLSDCTPDCGSGTNAVANGGTCVCATTHYGTPVDANGATVAAATQGCSPVAQTAAIPQYAVTVANPGVIRIDGHGLYTGQKLLYTKVGGGTALTTSVGALADGTAQYVIKVDANTFKLATSKTLALAGTALQITNDGDDAQIFTPVSSGVCPTNSATAYTAAAAGTGSLADCKVAAGYYIATESATATDATGLVISQVPANSYGAGGEAASQQTDNDVAATKTACVARSTSAAGSNAISGCKTAAGFYLSVASPSATGSGRIAKSEANKYSAGGTSISTTTTETPTACTYGGTSAIGSDAAADCTPSCGTVADASSGTCVCKAGRTGTPTPTTAAVTGGCTATLCAANQKVTSNACFACAAGTTNAVGDDATGADTTCAATTCTADHYVSSNVCTDCAAGSTNAAGDDASGADTTCDTVSGASPLEVKLTSMISFLVIGFLALAM